MSDGDQQTFAKQKTIHFRGKKGKTLYEALLKEVEQFETDTGISNGFNRVLMNLLQKHFFGEGR